MVSLSTKDLVGKQFTSSNQQDVQNVQEGALDSFQNFDTHAAGSEARKSWFWWQKKSGCADCRWFSNPSYCNPFIMSMMISKVELLTIAFWVVSLPSKLLLNMPWGSNYLLRIVLNSRIISSQWDYIPLDSQWCFQWEKSGHLSQRLCQVMMRAPTNLNGNERHQSKHNKGRFTPQISSYQPGKELLSARTGTGEYESIRGTSLVSRFQGMLVSIV